MKSPKLASIPEGTPDTSFSEKARKAKRTAKKGDLSIKRSFTMSPEDSAYIDGLGVKLGAKRGKSMNASETLRAIIADHRGRS